MDFWTRTNSETLDQWRLQARPGRVVAQVAEESNCTYPGCGWDARTQSGKKMDCPWCHGSGKRLEYREQVLMARVVWGPTALNYFQPTPGVELGEVSLGITSQELALVENVLASERSYLVVDNLTVRPINTSPSIIPGVGSGYFVACNRFTPREA